jgi:hypothetical protein
LRGSRGINVENVDYAGLVHIWSGSETAVTIVAASIPFLRVLVRNISRKATKKYYRNAGNELDVMSANNSTKVRTVTVARGKHAEAPGRADDRSDKSILGEEVMNGDNVIVHREFYISYPDQESRSQTDLALTY